MNDLLNRLANSLQKKVWFFISSLLSWNIKMLNADFKIFGFELVLSPSSAPSSSTTTTSSSTTASTSSSCGSYEK